MLNLALSYSLFASTMAGMVGVSPPQAAEATVRTPVESAHAVEPAALGPSAEVKPETKRDSDGPLRSYLRRPLSPSARFLDHGVLQVGVAPGLPHLYRWQLQLGLFDHLSAGVSMHWLEGQARPRFVPHGALALYRSGWLELGASYRQVLHTPDEAEEFGFELRSHYMFGTIAFARGPWSAGLDGGVVHFRGSSIQPDAEPGTYRWRTLAAGGLFARFGTRRWGLAVQGQMPIWTLELMLDLRFGLFESRDRGGWALKPR